MSERNQSDSQNVPDEVWLKIREIADKSVLGDYIYRGEAECHPKVCSGLYRPYLKSEIEDPDIRGSQNVILEKVRTYLPEISDLGDDEILTQLQHYGCQTNLIDFTTDYLIALFFACGEPEGGTGRVILLPKPQCTDNYRVVSPRRTISRIESQKSILVESKTGFVQPACIVFIRSELKRPMLDYLKKCHDISEERIYNDIHGFIKWPEILPHALEDYQAQKAEEERQKAEEEKREKDAKAASRKTIAHSNAALALVRNARNYADRAQFEFGYGMYDRAAADYSELIKLEPENAMAYRNRGLAYSEGIGFDGAFDADLESYDKAIELDAKRPIFYFERALLWLRKEEWNRASADLEAAQNRGANLRVLFNQKIRDFEKRYGVELPEDIAEMLTSEGTQEED